MTAVLLAFAAIMPFLVVFPWDRGYELPKLIVLWSLGVVFGGAGLYRVALRGWGRVTVIDIGMLLWIFAGLAAVIISTDPYYSVFGSYERGMGLLTELSGVGIWLGVRSYYQRHWYSRVVVAAVAMGIGLVISGILQRVFYWPTDFVMIGGVDTPRMSGTLGNSLFFGTALAVLFPFALELTMRKWWWKKILGSMAVLILGWGIMQSLSRTAVVGTFTGLIVWGIACMPAVSRRRQALVVILAISTLMLSLGIVSPWLKARLALDASARIRLADWTVAWQEGIRVPWGHGQETFWRTAIMRPKFPGEPNDGYSDRAHNLILDELYSRGVIGVAGLCLMLGAGFSVWWRKRNELPALGGALAALVACLMFLFHFSVSFLFLTVFLGMLAAIAKQRYTDVLQ